MNWGNFVVGLILILVLSILYVLIFGEYKNFNDFMLHMIFVFTFMNYATRDEKKRE